MKKLSRKNLDELAKVMPVLSETEQRMFVGGGSGTASDPYTMEEFERMLASGTWEGGYVLYGNSSEPVYTSPDVIINGDASNVFPSTVIESYDKMYKGGYQIGYDAAMSETLLDDILAIVMSGFSFAGAGGSGFGDVNYDMIWYANGIRAGYSDGLKDKER